MEIVVTEIAEQHFEAVSTDKRKNLLKRLAALSEPDGLDCLKRCKASFLGDYYFNASGYCILLNIDDSKKTIYILNVMRNAKLHKYLTGKLFDTVNKG